MKRVIGATLLGGIVCMVWGTLSWMVMGWHNQEIHSFDDEAAVTKLLRENAPRHGVYMLPHSMVMSAHPKSESAKADREAADLTHKTGPFFLGVVRPGVGGWDMTTSLMLALGRSLLASLLVAGLLSMTARLDFLQRVLFCTLCGAFAGVAVDLPMLVWFESPLRYTLINMADHVMEWFLAGLAISGMVTGKDL